ncbi:PepSY-associated TM helix domain-containing protein [Kangiella japonica]
MTVKKISTKIHKWLGIALSLWLFLVTLTGTLLLYKNELLKLQYPQLEQQDKANQQQAIRVLESGALSEQERYAFVPTDLHPWIESIDDNRGRLYYSPEGDLLLHRPRYGDWISWFVEFHHHLLLDDFGEELQGILGLLALIVMITGLIKWWPKGRFKKRDIAITFSRPTKKKWGQTLWQSHRSLSVVLFLPMLLLVLTGIGMIYSASFNSGLNILFPQVPKTVVNYKSQLEEQHKRAERLPSDWLTRIREMQKLLPDAQTIMIYLDRDRLRLKLPEEWHPNGRSYVGFVPGTSKLSEVVDYRNQTLGTKLSHKIYPLHIGEVGGWLYFSLVVISGVSLLWVCLSGVWFWLWCRAKKKNRKTKKK